MKSESLPAKPVVSGSQSLNLLEMQRPDPLRRDITYAIIWLINLIDLHGFGLHLYIKPCLI